ncbi:hypothetical protein JQ581_32255 [Bradyrhizobium liaoningense]|nr:hypothetical protein [Bradyrhizobium liaoningense]MBR0741617.1 hypothetical protein [Bradyrhizobium liaoningense]
MALTYAVQTWRHRRNGPRTGDRSGALAVVGASEPMGFGEGSAAPSRRP